MPPFWAFSFLGDTPVGFWWWQGTDQPFFQKISWAPYSHHMHLQQRVLTPVPRRETLCREKEPSSVQEEENHCMSSEEMKIGRFRNTYQYSLHWAPEFQSCLFLGEGGLDWVTASVNTRRLHSHGFSSLKFYKNTKSRVGTLSVWHFLDWRGASPGQVVLGGIRKVTLKQVRK